MSDRILDEIMPPVMIGMKVDSMNDNVDSYPAGASAVPIGFGRVCVFMGGVTPNHRVISGVAGIVAGVALQDHLVGAYGPEYRQHDAVSVLTRGRVWAEVANIAASDTIVFGRPVAFQLTTGRVTDGTGNPANTQPLVWAQFRSGVVYVPPIWPSGSLGTTERGVALVELNMAPYQAVTA